MKNEFLRSVCGLLFALGVACHLDVRADDKPESPGKPAVPEAAPKTNPKRPVPQQLSGKVVACDKYGKSITLQVNNVSYVLQIADATRFSLAGRERSIRDVVVGEQINVTVLLRELADGRVEIAVLAVELGVSEEAQGRKRGKNKGKNNQGLFHGPPSTSPTNDAPSAPRLQ